MTAPIIELHTGQPRNLTGTGLPFLETDGDLTTKIFGPFARPAGSLWQRVAERVPFGPTRPAGYFARTMRARRLGMTLRLAARQREADRRDSGHREMDAPIGKAGSYRGYSRSGIIRAGVRVK